MPTCKLYYSSELYYWSFDVFGAPNDFQKCYNTAFCFAINCLRSVGITKEQLFKPDVFIEFKYTEDNGQFVLDVRQKPFCIKTNLIRDIMTTVDKANRPIIMKLGPKWYLFSMSCDTPIEEYDYDLIIRTQYPGEDLYPTTETSSKVTRSYSIIDDQGEIHPPTE